MDMLPVTADYDQISDRMRQFAAQRLMETIESMRPAVEDAFTDQIHDIEPARIQAHVAVLKLWSTLLQQLGALYRVTDRPVQHTDEMMPLAAVQQLLEEQQARTEEAVAAAAAAALEQGRLEARTAEVVSLDAARERVTRQLRQLQG